VAKTHVVAVHKDAAKFVGSEAIKTAANIATDAIDGKELNESVKERAQESNGSLSEKTQALLQKGGNENNIEEIMKKRKRSKKMIMFRLEFYIKELFLVWLSLQLLNVVIRRILLILKFDLTQISVTVDNHDVPNSPLNRNFKENSYNRAHYNLFSGINRAGLDWGNEITKEDFIGGYGFFSFD
jgi:hypothetical protein